MTRTRTVGILGAGPGGLMLAKLLAVHGISSTIFERDAGPDARGQGGSLDLHTDSGQRALELAGLGSQFRELARYDDQEVKVYDKFGRVLHEERDAALGDRPEVDRGALRRILLDSLPRETIVWGTRVRNVERGAIAGHTFDLVVGADGTWSRVRPLLTHVKPWFSGVTFVELEIDDVDTRHPELAAAVGRGKIFALGDRKALIAQRNSGGNLRIYVAQHTHERWARELARRSPAEIKALLAESLSDWSPLLRGFVAQAIDRALPLPLYALPVGFRWQHVPGVTLLGDAAHVMSPFAGEGVNNAMRDALELAQALAREADWEVAVARYEQEMFTRIESSAQASADGLDMAMAPDGAQQMANFMRAHSHG